MAPVNDSGNSGGREIANGADQRRPKQFDPTRSTSKWLEHLASAKVGEELIGHDHNDLGLGFDKYLGFATTTIEIKGIEANKLRVYKKGEIYCITTSDKAQRYIGDGYKLQTIYGKTDQDLGLIEELEKNLDKIKWDLPKIHAIKTTEEKNNGDSTKKQKTILEVFITDSEKNLLQRMKDTASGTRSDAGHTPKSEGKHWKRILPKTDTGIDLNNKEKLGTLKHSVRERLESYLTKKVEKSMLSLGLLNGFQRKDIQFQIGNLYAPKDVPEQGDILVTNKKHDESWIPVDVAQLRRIQASIRNNQGQIKYDLKVYLIQPPDNTNTENKSDNKDPKILVTDDRSLVARRIKQGWKALPGTQMGIELSGDEANHQRQKEIYDRYEAICRGEDPVDKPLHACEELFSKLYWDDIPGNEREYLEDMYQKTLSGLADGAEQTQRIESFKQGLIKYVKEQQLNESFEEDLAKLGDLAKSGEDSDSGRLAKTGEESDGSRKRDSDGITHGELSSGGQSKQPGEVEPSENKKKFRQDDSSKGAGSEERTSGTGGNMSGETKWKKSDQGAEEWKAKTEQQQKNLLSEINKNYKLVNVPTDGMNCLLYAVLRGYGYDDKDTVDCIVGKVRDELAGSRKQENSHQWRTARDENAASNNERGEIGSMLDLADTDGQAAIGILRKDNQLDDERGIVVRVQESNSVQWIWEAIPSQNGKKPIYLHLGGSHFQALIEKTSENQ